MRSKLEIAMPLVLLLGVAGCEREAPAPQAASTVPASQPSAVVDHNPSTEPIPSVMLVDQHRLEFPPARLQLRSEKGKITALLFSDDPKDAISDTYAGNAYYLSMDLDITDPAEIGQAVWHFTSTSSERKDSPFGIFLHGNKQQLQPQNVTVQFDRDDSGTIIWISGTWYQFDGTEESATPKLVPVTARLRPTMKSSHKS